MPVPIYWLGLTICITCIQFVIANITEAEKVDVVCKTDNSSICTAPILRPLPEHAYAMLKNGQRVCRIVNGLWQVSGFHSYRPDPARAIADMDTLVSAGYTTFDLADHYGPAEVFVGDFIERRWKRAKVEFASKATGNNSTSNTTSIAYDSNATAAVQDDTLMTAATTEHGEPLSFHTKWVPSPGAMPAKKVRRALDTSRYRMAMPTLDLVAFHWWDYSDLRYRDMLSHAAVLTMPQSQDGSDITKPPILKGLAVTNFDLEHLQEIVEPSGALMQRSGFRGVDVVSAQVSFSIIDSRPLDGGLLRWSERHGISIMAYGVLMGGFLSDAWLGVDEPTPEDDPSLQLDTASLQKYFGFLLRWGSWQTFQELLRELRRIANKHQMAVQSRARLFWSGFGQAGYEWQYPSSEAKVSIAHVAIRWVLQQSSPSSSATICTLLGTRIGHPWGLAAKHAHENSVVFAFELDAKDLADIDRARTAPNTRPLLNSLGDCGSEYRHVPGEYEGHRPD